MALLIAVIFFITGYYFSNFRNKKKLVKARFLGRKHFIYLYCGKLHEMCNTMLEKVTTGTQEDKERTMFAHMLTVLSNVHDELVEISNDGENKLIEFMQKKINDRKAFGTNLDKKMKNLIAFEDELTAEDATKGLEIVSKNFQLINETKVWVNDYTKNNDKYIKTAAIETIVLLDAKKEVLKLLEKGLKTGNNTPAKEAKTALDRQANQSDQYVNAMKLLFGSLYEDGC